MSDDYQVRKDLNRVMNLANQLEEALANSGVNTLSELLSKYYDSSDVDVKNWKLNDDLEDTTAIAEGAENKATTANSRATEVRKVLFSGSSDTGTSGNPASGTVKANLNTAQGDIVNIQTDVDTLLLKNSSWQILHIGAVDNVSINTILTNYPLFNINNVNYALNNNQGYVRDGNNWINHSITNILDKIDIAFVTCLTMNIDTETILSTYDLEFAWVYDISQDCFYKYQNNQWIVESNLDVYGKMFRNQIGVNIIDMIYPIGSIYMSVNTINPTSFIGGTWVQLTDTFLYATSGTADTFNTPPTDGTRGEATHTLTTDEMPSHTHIQNEHYHELTGFSGGSGSDGAYTQSSSRKQTSRNTQSTRATNQNTGGGQAHNNMPPYMKVYMWKRTG